MERPKIPEIDNEPYYVEHTETGETFDINDGTYETCEGVLRLGVYRHYKSTQQAPKYYGVEKVVRPSDADESKKEEWLVIYRDVDGPPDTPVYARPYEMFTGNVRQGKGEIPRFRFAWAGH